MGRTPFFSYDKICRPRVDQSLTNLQLLTELQDLQAGQKIKIEFVGVPTHFGIPRSISVYEYTPSEISSEITYVVDSTNYEPGIASVGLRAIALRDPQISEAEHITGWVITSDGYFRDTEHYTIFYRLKNLTILE